MHKDFDEWNKLKQCLDKKSKPRTFNEREIWWCSIGVNIGFEVCGKSELFNRPVLVLKKHSKNIFLGVPLTSNCEPRKHRLPIVFKGKNGSLLLDQISAFDSRRFDSLMGKINEPHFETIKQVIRHLL